MFSATLTIRFRNEFGIIRVFRSNNMVPIVHIYLVGANLERFFASVMRLLNSNLSFNNIATIISAHIDRMNRANSSERNISTNMSPMNLIEAPSKEKLEIRSTKISDNSSSQQLTHHQDIKKSPRNIDSPSDDLMEDIIVRINRLHLIDTIDVMFSHVYISNQYLIQILYDLCLVSGSSRRYT